MKPTFALPFDFQVSKQGAQELPDLSLRHSLLTPTDFVQRNLSRNAKGRLGSSVAVALIILPFALLKSMKPPGGRQILSGDLHSCPSRPWCNSRSFRANFPSHGSSCSDCSDFCFFPFFPPTTPRLPVIIVPSVSASSAEEFPASEEPTTGERIGRLFLILVEAPEEAEATEDCEENLPPPPSSPPSPKDERLPDCPREEREAIDAAADEPENRPLRRRVD